MASEIFRERQYANFKPPRSQRGHKQSNWRAKRPGMSEEHLTCVRQLPCCICGKTPAGEAHHLRIASERGGAMKAPDKYTVPLCPEHHTLGVDRVHKVGGRLENRWFAERGIADVLDLAAALWNTTGDLDRMKLIVEAHREGGK